jgi:hypothetical protein
MLEYEEVLTRLGGLVTQGSSFLATLGWMMESRWDSTLLVKPWARLASGSGRFATSARCKPHSSFYVLPSAFPLSGHGEELVAGLFDAVLHSQYVEQLALALTRKNGRGDVAPENARALLLGESRNLR